MKQRMALFLVSALVSAVGVAGCGGGQTEPTQPSNPSESAGLDAASPSPAASAAPSAAPSASAPPAVAPSASASASEKPPAGPPGPGDWDKWSHDQKLAYMKSDVMPKMGKVFHDFDAKKYDEPKCILCHGAGVKDGSFTMPNPDLPKLDLSPAGFKKLKAKHAKVFEFMAKQVEPAMADLLGEPVYDPKTQHGFGCLGCHTLVDSPKK
jgi:hypothetical protein